MKIKLINSVLNFKVYNTTNVILTKTFLGGNNEMTGENDNFLMAIVEVSANVDYKIYSTGNNAVFAFLNGIPKNYMHGKLMTPFYAECDNPGRVLIEPGRSKQGFTGDAKYLLVSLKSTTSWKPSEISIDGIDYLSVINDAVENPDTPYL